MPDDFLFMPWKGAAYDDISPRLLIVGESHYGNPTDNVPGLTNAAIIYHAIGRQRDEKGRLKRHKLFNDLYRLLTGESIALSNEDQRRAAWDRVAYVNAVQRCMLDRTERPSRKDWLSARPALNSYVSLLAPDHLLILGNTLRGALFHDQSFPSVSNTHCEIFIKQAIVGDRTVACGFIPHPASRGFSAIRWHKACNTFLNRPALF